MANRYVRSTGGNWSTAGTWESASGLKDTVAVPTASDDVYLDGQSGQLTVSTTTAVCKSINCVDGTGGAYTGTLTFTASQKATVSGSVKFSTGMIIAGTGTMTLHAAGTVTPNGKRFSGSVIIDAAITITLAGAFWMDGTLTLTGATTFSGAYDITCNALTLSVAATHTLSGNVYVANALTINTGAAVVNGAFNLYVYGNLTLTAQPISGAATIVLCGTGTWSASSVAAIVLNNLTINTPGTLTISGTVYYSTGTLTYTAGAIVNTSSTLDLRGGCTISSKFGPWFNVTFTTAGTYDVQGLWATGTISLPASCTWTNFIIAGDPIISITTATTQTVNGSFIVRNSAITGTADHATISAAGAIVVFFCSISNIDFSGAGSFTSYGGTDVVGNSNITFSALPYTRPTVCYIDYANGNDGYVTPWGFWCVDYTGGSGTAPAVGETMTGATSGATAKVTHVEVATGSWAGNNAAGTIWFYGKSSTAFVAEQVDCAVSGHCHITADFISCAWKTISGATAGRIVPGDIIRIAKSADPVALGINGTWYDIPAALPASLNIESSTNAGPINVVITGHGYSTGDLIYIQDHATNLTANGTWVITRVDDNNFTLDGSTGVGVGGATGTATKIEWHCVKLASALTKTITRCEEAWTADNAATVTKNTSYYKEGDASAKIVKSSPLNSTLYAHVQIGGGVGVNFSAYQKISFWIKVSTVLKAKQWKLCLCSDTAGAVIVDTIEIPANPGWEWTCLTLAGNNPNLGASIQSVALYSDISAGTTSAIYLDNIIACTTDGLSLQSLISKSALAQDSVEGFCAIQSISEDGKVVRIDNAPGTLASSFITIRNSGYVGTGETVAAYKLEATKTIFPATYGTSVQAVQKGGSVGNNIQFQGGYNTADLVQDGESFFDGICGGGEGLFASTLGYVTINYLNFYRYYDGVWLANCDYFTFTNLNHVCHNSVYGMRVPAAYDENRNTFSRIRNINGNGHSGVSIYLSEWNTLTHVDNANSNLQYGVYVSAYNSTIGTVVNACNNGYGVLIGGYNCKVTLITNASYNRYVGVYPSAMHSGVIDEVTNANYNQDGIYFYVSSRGVINKVTNANYNTRYGAYFQSSHESMIMSISTTGNATAAFGSIGYRNYVRDATCAEGTLADGAATYLNGRLCARINGNPYIYTDGGIIQGEAVERHTASGISWKMSPNSINRTSAYPLTLPIAKVACSAGNEVTVNAWVKKSNGDDIGAKLICKKLQLAGITVDSVDTKLNDTDWEKLEIKFTPSTAGVVEIEAQAYWIQNDADESVYVDDVVVAQA